MFRSFFDVKALVNGVHSNYQNFMLISNMYSVFLVDALFSVKISVFHVQNNQKKENFVIILLFSLLNGSKSNTF
jgi:hypothetical protein